MTSVTLTLGHHDFLCAIEGFARGSHLRQHVWEDIVWRNLSQMDAEFMDFLWYYLRRDIWQVYFDKYGHSCGREDFLHILAALHRGNRYMVKFKPEGKKKALSVLAYRFQNEYRPLTKLEGQVPRFNSFIPAEWIVSVEQLPMVDNENVACIHTDWWLDLEVYDKDIESLVEKE